MPEVDFAREEEMIAASEQSEINEPSEVPTRAQEIGARTHFQEQAQTLLRDYQERRQSRPGETSEENAAPGGELTPEQAATAVREQIRFFNLHHQPRLELTSAQFDQLLNVLYQDYDRYESVIEDADSLRAALAEAPAAEAAENALSDNQETPTANPESANDPAPATFEDKIAALQAEYADKFSTTTPEELAAATSSNAAEVIQQEIDKLQAGANQETVSAEPEAEAAPAENAASETENNTQGETLATQLEQLNEQIRALSSELNRQLENLPMGNDELLTAVSRSRADESVDLRRLSQYYLENTEKLRPNGIIKTDLTATAGAALIEEMKDIYQQIASEQQELAAGQAERARLATSLEDWRGLLRQVNRGAASRAGQAEFATLTDEVGRQLEQGGYDQEVVRQFHRYAQEAQENALDLARHPDVRNYDFTGIDSLQRRADQFVLAAAESRNDPLVLYLQEIKLPPLEDFQNTLTGIANQRVELTNLRQRQKQIRAQLETAPATTSI